MGGWHADYPDAENFMQLLYSKNAFTEVNQANYQNPEFDALYLKLKQSFDPVEKAKLVSEMNSILDTHVPWLYFF